MPPALVHLVAPPRLPTERPPLLVLLHGVGSNEHDLLGIVPAAVDARYMVVSVRAPLTLQPGAYGWYEVAFTPHGIVWNREQAEASRRQLIDFVAELRAAHPVDPERVLLLGFSQGAGMALAVALARPDLVAGVVALSGRLLIGDLPELAPPEQLRGMPLLVQHGLYDQVLPIEHGRATRDELARLPVELTYQEYPIAHHVSPESLAAVSRWLGERLG